MTPSKIKSRIGAAGILCGLLGASLVHAGDFSTYRGLQFGMTLSAAARLPGTRPTEVRIAHKQPAVIQEMDWQPRAPALSADPLKADPVKDGLLFFFNGELFRIVVTYDRYKVEGLSAADIIEAISATYGAATNPTDLIRYHSNYAEVTPVLARWEDADYSYNLVNTGDKSSYAMVLYSKRVDALAQAAIIEAVRLETQSAPQREIDKQKKKEEDARLLLEKARAVNKPNFRP